EEAFGREAALEPLEREEMLSEPEALDGGHAESELATRFPELGAALRVHRLTLLEAELEAVEDAALDRRLERGAPRRVAARAEHRRPRLVAPELRHLALDPDGGDPTQVPRDAAVERGHRVDLAIAVQDRLDLHRGSVPPPSWGLGSGARGA